MTTAESTHPWRARWSARSLEGRTIALGGRFSKWDRQPVVALVEQEGGSIVEELTSETSLLIVVASSGKPSRIEVEAAKRNQETPDAIEVLSRYEFEKKLLPTRDETIEMLRAGPDAQDRWEELVRWVHVDIRPDVSGADLRGARVAGFSFESVKLREADLRDADLTGVQLPGLKGVQFDGANLRGAQIQSIERGSFVACQASDLIVGSGMGGPVGKGCDFSRACLTRARFFRFDGTDGKFTDADLSGAAFAEGKQAGPDYTGAKLIGVVFYSNPVERGVFRNADLQDFEAYKGKFLDSDFRGANLRRANFMEADLTGAIFDDADVTDANFFGAKLNPDQLAKARGTPAARREPQRSTYAAALQQSYPPIGFSTLDFVVVTPTGRRLTSIVSERKQGAYFYEARCHAGTEITPANVRTFLTKGGGFSEIARELLAYLGPHAKLAPETIVVGPAGAPHLDATTNALCELFDQPLFTPDDRAAAAAAEKRESAALKKTMLAELKAGPEGIAKFNARLEAGLPKTSFAKADLTSATLDGLRLSGEVEFDGAKFDGASLVNGRLDAINLKKARFVGATIRDSVIRSNLAGSMFENAVLENVDLRRAELQKSNFTGARVTRCRFFRTNFEGADLSQATFDGCDWRGAVYDQQTLLPPGFTHTPIMRWTGQGPPPHVFEAEKQKAAQALATAAAPNASGGGSTREERRTEFMRQVRSHLDPTKVANALKMLKADKFELFVESGEKHLVGVVKSQSSEELVYACRLASDGSYTCCTQNLRACGGLRGSPCKHLLVLTLGLERSDHIAPETLGLWLTASRNRSAALDKDAMAEVFLRYKGAQAGEVDWRPTETTPEDFYAL